jgi:hypothetical protein
MENRAKTIQQGHTPITPEAWNSTTVSLHTTTKKLWRMDQQLTKTSHWKHGHTKFKPINKAPRQATQKNEIFIN